jgi:Arc/MetJ family transcription regulator
MTGNLSRWLAVSLLWLNIATSLHADEQLETLKHISAAGAPFLTLKMLDQAQPGVDQNLYEWILWEQERYRILSEWAQWNDLLVRIESQPADLPEQFRQQASSYRIRAYMELGQNSTARKLLREQLWRTEADHSSEYRQWRQLIVQTYLNEGRNDDARIAMLRLQQDFDIDDRDWIMLRARVLMQVARYDEVVSLLARRLDWESLVVRLLAEYRKGLHSAQILWDLAQKRIEFIKDDDRQLAGYWTVAAIAARDLNPVNEVLALEARLGLDVQDSIRLDELNAGDLWEAYLKYARLVGNRAELLLGDDNSWLQLADNGVKVTPVKSRSLYALLLRESRDETIKTKAANGFLRTLDLESSAQQVLLEQLFGLGQHFENAAQIPVQIRFQLVDLALKKGQIENATRLMSGLDRIPEGSEPLDWLLRRARVLLLGGEVAQGNEVLDQLIDSYKEPSEEDTDRILQVLFDLQTIKANDHAIRHFRKLLTLPISARQRREILFWMADSFKGLDEYERAALLYLQSAMFTGPDSMDPWAQTARFNAAEALQRAGLVDDARRIYNALLKVTKEPARRSLLRHNIQKLWLTQNAD